MTSLWLVMSALECAEQYAEAFGAGYARGLWHGGGAVILTVVAFCIVLYFAKRGK